MLSRSESSREHPQEPLRLLRRLSALWSGKEMLAGKSSTPNGVKLPALLTLGASPVAAVSVASSLMGTAWTFLKVGFVFFGGGFVLVPVLHHKLVVSLGWLSPQTFRDAVGVLSC